MVARPTRSGTRRPGVMPAAWPRFWPRSRRVADEGPARHRGRDCPRPRPRRPTGTEPLLAAPGIRKGGMAGTSTIRKRPQTGTPIIRKVKRTRSWPKDATRSRPVVVGASTRPACGNRGKCPRAAPGEPRSSPCPSPGPASVGPGTALGGGRGPRRHAGTPRGRAPSERGGFADGKSRARSGAPFGGPFSTPFSRHSGAPGVWVRVVARQGHCTPASGEPRLYG